MSRAQRLPDRPKKATGSFGETSRRHRIEVPSGPVPIDLRQNSLWQTGRTPHEIKSLIHPKAESYAAPRSSNPASQAECHTHSFCRPSPFSWHRYQDRAYLHRCSLRLRQFKKTTFGARGFLDPDVEAPLREVKIPTA
jgi:hypothetical protein